MVDRAHVAVRWASCPFGAAVEAMPRSGRFFELGCGHGLFSTLLALDSHDRHVFGTDIDAGKVGTARAAAEVARASGAHLDFEQAEAGTIADGPWDGIGVIDVLYLLEPATQQFVVDELAHRLAPGGTLVIKEMDVTPRWKHRWNRSQETLAVRLLGITAGGPLTFLPAASLAGFVTDAGLEVVESRRVDHHYVHPHHLLVARRPG